MQRFGRRSIVCEKPRLLRDNSVGVLSGENHASLGTILVTVAFF